MYRLETVCTVRVVVAMRDQHRDRTSAACGCGWFSWFSSTPKRRPTALKLQALEHDSISEELYSTSSMSSMSPSSASSEDIIDAPGIFSR